MIFEYGGYSKQSGIYEIRNRLSGKSYIGSAQRFKERWKNHFHSLRNGKHQNKRLQYSYNKWAGDLAHDNFIEFHIIELMLDASKEERLEREAFWIAQAVDIYGRENVYNMRLDPKQENKEWSKFPTNTKEKMSAAHRGKKLSNETKKRISAAKKGVPNTTAQGIPRLESTKQKISKANTGKRRTEEAKKRIAEGKKGHSPWNKGLLGDANPLYGHSVSVNTREKISKANKGRKMTELVRKKISECHKGIPCTEAAKEKLRKAFAGRVFSEETRQKLKEAWVRRKEVKLQFSAEAIPIPEKPMTIAVNEANTQLLKLAELVYKAKDKQETDEIPNSRDLFERMKQNRG